MIIGSFLTDNHSSLLLTYYLKSQPIQASQFMVLIPADHCSQNSDKGQSAKIYSSKKLSLTIPLAEKQMEKTMTSA